MRKFKYHQTFATKHIKLVYPEEKNVALALASLESLKTLLPPGLDIAKNPDLLFNSFNAAVVNRVNLNDDGIQTVTALKLYKNFIHKFCDLEHERTSIVGSIINAGLSEFLTNRIVSEAEATSIKTPFNISLGSVVWPVVDPQFAEMLAESSDETSPNFESISASWEIGFDEMYIAVGSRDLSEAEIITDEKRVSELKQYLRIYDGTGSTKQNEPVYRIIAGDALPLGIGYTTTPAADVKGVIVSNTEKVEEIKETGLPEKEATPAREIIELNSITQENNEEKDKSEKNSSQHPSNTVKNISIMKINKLDDITDENFSELSAAAVRNFVGKQIAEELEKASEEYALRLEEKEKEAKARKEEAEQVKKQFEDARKDLDALSAQLKQEQEARAAEKAQADFNSRMADLETKFVLGEKETAVIAKKIRGLDDAAYAEWLSDFEILSAAKKKDAEDDEDAKDGGSDEADEGEDPNEDSDEDKKKKKSKSAKASVEDALDEVEEAKKKDLVNTPSVEKTVRDEFAEAFKPDDFKIRVRK